MKLPPCLEGFARHHWRSAGLDVTPAGDFVRCRECPSCGLRQIAAYNGRAPSWRPAC